MSIRVRLAGRDPSTFALGTDSARSIVDPRRFASMTGAAGVRTIGGSGGPFCPHAIVQKTINAEIAEISLRAAIYKKFCVLVDRAAVAVKVELSALS